jgi:hypothetical protein
MRFQVPQFIGVEDTIFGPFTAKQFVFMAGGGALCYIVYKFLPLYFALIVIIPVAILSISLAFVKVNGKPFIFTLEAGLKYMLSSKIYLWKKSEVKFDNIKYQENIEPAIKIPPIRRNEAEELSNILDLSKRKK